MLAWSEIIALTSLRLFFYYLYVAEGKKSLTTFFSPVKNKDTKRHPAVLEEVIAAE